MFHLLVDSRWKAFFFDVCSFWLCVFTVMHKCILKAHMKVEWSILEIVSCQATVSDRYEWRNVVVKVATNCAPKNKLMCYK